MKFYTQASEHAYDFPLEQADQVSTVDDWASVENQALIGAFNCAGTAGTFGTAGGCVGTFGSFGCANCLKPRAAC